MPAYSLCCLSNINLSKLVKNKFQDVAEFDWERFKYLIHVGVRFLDNVLDVTEYPIDKIEELSTQWRRIGLGITGLADMFIMLKLKYGSKESVDFTDHLAKILAHESYSASVLLAQEKGSFPAFDKNIGNYGFIKKLDRDLQKSIQEKGLRNIGLNSIPPTGTTSLTLGNNCSSGIEPIFSLEYTRNITQKDGSRKPEKVYDNGWLEYKDLHSEEKAPEYIITAHQIPIKESIDVQAAFQKWIDHSISKTINLPFETTLEEYKDIFMYSYKKGLKGITSFHEGASMEGILSTQKKDKERLAPKRPKELPCDIYEMSVNKQKCIALVGIYNNKPYEVFLTDDPDDIINIKKSKQGKIIKEKTSVYTLKIAGKRSDYILKDITSVFDNEWATLGRLVSMSLRHDVPLQFIVDQLNKSKRFGTFSKGMARVLKKYIEEKQLEEKCPECGELLKYEGGCSSCPSCGYSKCD